MTAPTTPLRLLNINDEPARRYVISHAARRAGFEVIEAETGAEAISRAGKDGPAVIVLDVRLPDMNGFDVCQTLKADPLTAAIPILLYSAYHTEDDDKLRGLNIADGYIAEPVSPSMLEATLRALLRARRAEQAARAAELGERFFFEALPVPAWVFDPQTFMLLRVNEAALRFFGYSRDEMLGMLVSDLRPPEDRNAAVLTSKSGDTAELWRLQTRDGEVRDAEVFARPLSLDGRDICLAVSHDVTEQRRAEARVTKSERLLRDILDHSDAVVYLKDTEGRYLTVNRRYEELTHTHREKIFGKTDYDIFPRADAEVYRANDSHVIQLRRPVHVEERVVVDNTVRTFLEVKFPVFDAEGAVYAVCGIATDITERKQAEETMREARTAAEAANRAKDDFLAMLSHELRTPLSAMTSVLALLRSGVLPSAQAGEMLERLERATHAQTRLVTDLLDMSRIVSGKLEIIPQPLNLTEVVRDVVEAHRSEAEAKQLRLVADLAGRPLPATGDRVRLEQAVGNLIGNAIKFTPRRGEITVRLEEAADRARLTITDTGQGIPADVLPHIFERFRQADSTPARGSGGLGLGLAIVRYIIDEHRGTVRAESEGPGRGATFTVELPLGPSEPAAP